MKNVTFHDVFKCCFFVVSLPSLDSCLLRVICIKDIFEIRIAIYSRPGSPRHSSLGRIAISPLARPEFLRGPVPDVRGDLLASLRLISIKQAIKHTEPHTLGSKDHHLFAILAIPTV